MPRISGRLGLAGFVGAIVLALAGAGVAAGDSVGPIPGDAYTQSRCATFKLSRHFPDRGQKIVATVSEHPEWCNPRSTGWTFPFLGGTTMVHGCRPNTVECTYKVTGPATGSRGSRIQTACISGSSGQGPWSSCDYYAILPRCSGRPSFTVKHGRRGRETVVTFEGRHWDVPDCGAVTVTVAGERGDVGRTTFDSSHFRGVIRVNGRVCGMTLRAEQVNGRARSGGFDLGHSTDYVVLVAHPGTAPSGEQIAPGDRLCRSEAAFPPRRNLTAEDVKAQDAAFGQQLFELEAPGASFMVDGSGKVLVQGVSLEFADPALLSRVREQVARDDHTTNVSSTQQSTTVSGFGFSQGPITVNGDLNLDNGILYVGGDLRVTGAILGRGAVFATGGIAAGGGANLAASERFALVAGGALSLP